MQNDESNEGMSSQSSDVLGLICCNHEGVVFFVNDSVELSNLLTAGIHSLASVSAGTYQEFKEMEEAS